MLLDADSLTYVPSALGQNGNVDRSTQAPPPSLWVLQASDSGAPHSTLWVLHAGG